LISGEFDQYVNELLTFLTSGRKLRPKSVSTAWITSFSEFTEVYVALNPISSVSHLKLQRLKITKFDESNRFGELRWQTRRDY